MGVRELKKQKIRRSILEHARSSFLEKGYAETTLDYLAEKAEIGVGTLYNYFPSKADIFLAIMTEELAIEQEEEAKEEREVKGLSGNQSKNPVLLILDEIWKIEKSLTVINKETWKELVSAALSISKNENDLMEKLMHLDSHFILKMQNLLDTLKEKGKLAEGLPSSQAAFVIYSIAITQFILYVYSELTLPEIKCNIESQIGFVFADKVLD